jgi:hypothetical protein
MIEPHGGRLVYNVLEGDAARSYWEVSARLEVRPTLGPDGAPIRNPYREVVSIAYGFFSPLEGFMTWNEVESVLKERRLLNGWLFPSSDAERAPCGYEVFMKRALFVAGAGGCGRRDRRREAWDLWMRRF